MTLYRRRNTVFDRIGDQYGSFIDPDHFMGRSAFEESWMTTPAMNIRQSNNNFELEIGLPGYSKNNITVNVNNRILEVTAERNEIPDKKMDGEYILKELDTNQIKKTFELAHSIDTEKISSEYENGLLKIKLPKISTKQSAKAVAIS